MRSEPAHSEPAHSEPAHSEPAHSEPAHEGPTDEVHAPEEAEILAAIFPTGVGVQGSPHGSEREADSQGSGSRLSSHQTSSSLIGSSHPTISRPSHPGPDRGPDSKPNPAKHVLVGPGDDAAVLAIPGGRCVATTDTMVEGFDFLRETSTFYAVGVKAAVQNLADVAAMGAKPIAVLSAISAPTNTPLEAFTDVSRGLAERSELEGAVLAGGDLGGADSFTITITALGTLPEGIEPVRRSTAQPGNVLAAGSERLGRSAAGLAVILADHTTVRPVPASAEAPPTNAPLVLPAFEVEGIEDPSAPSLVAWHNAPNPDLVLGWQNATAATAMIDISDGLVRDARRIAEASNVIIDLDKTALAADADALAGVAQELEADPWQWVLHGGEEHAMLATFRPDDVPHGFRIIGTVRAANAEDAGSEPDVLLDGEPIDGRGWDHFGG